MGTYEDTPILLLIRTEGDPVYLVTANSKKEE